MTDVNFSIEDAQSLNPEKILKIVKIAGQLDESNIDQEIQVVYQLMETNPNNLDLIFDLENLEYMNSKSIGYMTDIYGKIREHNGKITIAKARPNIKDILQVVGLTQLIPIFDTIEEAKTGLMQADAPAAPVQNVQAAPEQPAQTAQVAPEQTIPEQTAQSTQAAPEQAMPEQTAQTAQAAPEQAMPEQTAQTAQVAPEQTIPEQTAQPTQVAPKQAMPTQTVQNTQAAPEQAMPNQAIENQKPNEGSSYTLG